MNPNPSIKSIFSLASAETPPKNTASYSQQDGPMTITVETACTGQARHLAEFIRDAMEYAGTTGAEHAGRSLVARAQAHGDYLAIRVEQSLH